MEIVINESMTREEAFNVMSQLQEATVKVKFYKGYVWNAMPYGDHEAICEEFGLKYNSMKEYGYVVKKFTDDILEQYPTLSYTHFKIAARKPDPEGILQLSCDEDWTSRELRRQLKETEERAKEQLLIEEMESKEEQADSEETVATSVGGDSTPYEKKVIEHQREREERERVVPYDVWRVFGTSMRQVNRESWGILKRHYAREYHPDVDGGSEERWSFFNRCVEYVETNVLEEFVDGLDYHVCRGDR